MHSRKKVTAALPCLVLLSGSCLAAQAATDVCAQLSPEILSTTLGGEFKGDYVSCVYTAKALTFEIRRWAYPNPVQRERTLQVAKARYAANARAKAISDLGDDAWAINEYVDVIQGPYEYYFAAYPTEEPNYHVDRTDQLTTIAKAFLSPQ
jgi:hypothetical protein